MTTQHQKRIGFKVGVKDKWVYSYWYNCNNLVDMPYDLIDFIKSLMSVSTDSLSVKVEKKTKQVYP